MPCVEVGGTERERERKRVKRPFHGEKLFLHSGVSMRLAATTSTTTGRHPPNTCEVSRGY